MGRSIQIYEQAVESLFRRETHRTCRRCQDLDEARGPVRPSSRLTTLGLTCYFSNHTGSHKINNAIGQILLARRIGKMRIIAETGAGQHGVATATVCARFGLECVVYMGAEDVRRQALNV